MRQDHTLSKELSYTLFGFEGLFLIFQNLLFLGRIAQVVRAHA